MSFIVTSPPAEPQESPITSSAFWPDIVPAEIRANHRIDGTIPSDRLRACLVEAMATVNSELYDWRAARELEGTTALADVAAERIDDVSILVHRYLRAVGCLAKAMLVERYRDFDSTANADTRADLLDPSVDDLRRDARWAISDITGATRNTVELI